MCAKTAARALAFSMTALAACAAPEGTVEGSPVDVPGGGDDGARAPTPHRGEAVGKLPRSVSSVARDPIPGSADVPRPTPPYVFASHPLGAYADRGWPLALGVTGGRVYWYVGSHDANKFVLASAAVAGGPTTTIAEENDLFAVFMGAHVVVYRYGSRDGGAGHLSVVPGGSTTETALPDSSACVAATSDAEHVYCLQVDPSSGYARQLRVWPIAGGAATDLATFPSDAMEVVASAGSIFVVRHGTTIWPPMKGAPPEHLHDGGIELVDPVSGAATVIRDGIAPNHVRVVNGALSWNDEYQPSATVAGCPRSSFVLPPYGTPIEATRALYFDPAWSFRPSALDTETNGIVVWTAASAPTPDLDLAANVRVRYVVGPWGSDLIAIDKNHVYWATATGVFRRAK